MTSVNLLSIDPEGMRKSATMSPAMVHDGVVYLSGVVPLSDAGELVGANDAEAQARNCLDTIERVLKAAGSDLAGIIRLTCYATSKEAARAYIKVRSERVTHRPAATAVMITETLIPGAMMEIEVIAAVTSQS
jgi:enamine deaminase RidA (YjgF/YER057c/UK114 family)